MNASSRRRTPEEKIRAMASKRSKAAAVALAAGFARDEDWEVRARALEVLREKGDSESLSVVRHALGDATDLVAVAAIECLVEWRAVRSANGVARLLESSSELTRSYAAWALGEIGGSRHVPVLRKRFRSFGKEIEGSALAEALYKITRQRRYFSHLLKQLHSRDPEVRAFTSNSLVGVTDARNFPEVISVLARRLARERSVVVRSSLRRDIEIVLDIVMELTQEPPG